LTDLSSIYTEIITEHSRSQEHRHEIEGATASQRGRNPSCGDELTLSLKVEGGVIEEAAFEGVGCAISQASADLMAELMEGKSVEEARALARDFLRMLRREEIGEDAEDALEDAVALKPIANMPARVKCAALAWHTLEGMLKNK